MYELLFLGNSYTFVNELDVVSAEVFVAGGVPEATATRLAEGGYTWVMHLDQTRVEGTAWEDALVDPGNAWEWVILQEQSQIPGFPHSNGEWRASEEAGAALDDLAAGLGAQTVLLLTWGRRLGDVDNPDLYPDFPTMQAALTDGYVAYRDAFSTPDRPVWIAPAGPAFQAVYDAVAADGIAPEDDGTLFSNLYQADGSHPSPAGTWLTAWVVYATVTGESPIGLPLPPELPADDAERLQAIADDVVLGNAAGWVYPWSADGTDPTDTDTPTDTDAPTDTDTPADTDGADPGDPAAGAACGCATSTPAPIAGLVGIGLLVMLLGCDDGGDAKTEPVGRKRQTGPIDQDGIICLSSSWTGSIFGAYLDGPWIPRFFLSPKPGGSTEVSSSSCSRCWAWISGCSTGRPTP